MPGRGDRPRSAMQGSGLEGGQRSAGVCTRAVGSAREMPSPNNPLVGTAGFCFHLLQPGSSFHSMSGTPNRLAVLRRASASARVRGSSPPSHAASPCARRAPSRESSTMRTPRQISQHWPRATIWGLGSVASWASSRLLKTGCLRLTSRRAAETRVGSYCLPIRAEEAWNLEAIVSPGTLGSRGRFGQCRGPVGAGLSSAPGLGQLGPPHRMNPRIAFLATVRKPSRSYRRCAAPFGSA